MKKGFTLIEVLVVVLIIGILTSVALPQYQKAILKSRLTQAKTLARAVAEAQEVYYATHNRYSARFDELDVDTPEYTSGTSTDTQEKRYFDWGNCWIHSKGSPRVGCDIGVIRYYIYFEEESSNKGRRMCYGSGLNEKSPQNQVCKQDTGDASGSKAEGGIYWYY